MAPVTKKNTVNRLDYNVPIVQSDGRPTLEFQRKWLQQANTNASITDLTTIAGVSAVLDLISAVKGSILTRGTTTWQALAGATGHDGWLLTWNDSTGLPEWRQLALSGIPAAFWIDGSGVGQMAMVDANGQEVLDASGFGIYIPNPTLPNAMIPAADAVNIGGVNYSEGTFTPSDASGAGVPFTVAQGFYIKLNKMCLIYGFITFGVSASGLQAVVGGLPFTVANQGTNGFPLPADALGAGTPCFLFFNKNTTTAGLGRYDTGGAVAYSVVSGTSMYYCMTYPTV